MPTINRESPEDAKKIVDTFINDEAVKNEILSFLSDSIIYANSINDRNWNLNLDKDGGFIRFNVGQEYCFEIFKSYISVLALKSYVPDKLLGKEFRIEFKGHNGRSSGDTILNSSEISKLSPEFAKDAKAF